jgi:hypothetical protein
MKVIVNCRGVSLVIALLILLIVTLIGISAIQTTTFETNIAGNEKLYNTAFYHSDAGIDYFYGTSQSYILLPNTGGTVESQSAGIDLGGGRFIVQWKKLGEEAGPPRKVEFLVTSEGIAPSFPTAGKVITEAVIEAIDEEAPPGYPGGSS